MNATVFRESPIVNVSMDIGFDMLSLRDHVPEFLRVDQTAWEVDGIAAQTRVMMRDNDRSFV